MSPIQTLGTFGAVLGLTFMTLLSNAESSSTTAVIYQQPLESPESQRQSGSGEVETEVKAFITHYIQTLEGGDEKTIRELFVADKRFTWFTDGAKKYSSPDEVLAGMQRYADITFKTAVSDVRVVPFGASLASARSKFHTKLTIPGSDDYEFDGVITWIVEKDQKTGKWRVFQGHTSTPDGPPKNNHRDTKRAEAREGAKRVEEQKDKRHAGVEKEVRAFLAHYINTLEDKNERAVRDLFVADKRFAWFTDGAKSYSTPEDVLAGMKRYTGTTFKTTLSEVRVVPFNESLASAHSKFQTKLTIPGSDDYEFGGVITWIVEKAPAAGGWRVLEGHTSTPGGRPSKGDQYKKDGKR